MNTGTKKERVAVMRRKMTSKTSKKRKKRKRKKRKRKKKKKKERKKGRKEERKGERRRKEGRISACLEFRRCVELMDSVKFELLRILTLMKIEETLEVEVGNC